MKQTLINGYLRIEPLEHSTFMLSQKETFEEIGTVVARDDVTCSDIPLGSKVYFDSFMAKKYPKVGEEGKFEWYIHRDEIVKFQHE